MKWNRKWNRTTHTHTKKKVRSDRKSFYRANMWWRNTVIRLTSAHTFKRKKLTRSGVGRMGKFLFSHLIPAIWYIQNNICLIHSVAERQTHSHRAHILHKQHPIFIFIYNSSRSMDSFAQPCHRALLYTARCRFQHTYKCNALLCFAHFLRLSFRCITVINVYTCCDRFRYAMRVCVRARSLALDSFLLRRFASLSHKHETNKEENTQIRIKYI